MTDPLIDRDALRKAIYRDSPVPMTDVAEVTDAVLAYLRDRLTPEALATVGEWLADRDGVRWARVVTPDGMYRRIFGEDG